MERGIRAQTQDSSVESKRSFSEGKLSYSIGKQQPPFKAKFLRCQVLPWHSSKYLMADMILIRLLLAQELQTKPKLFMPL